ncbi:hypothetical protein [Magnetococcus sp. PR-3]|uniref:hypothetical protein n=1 Tax=Magnetococcus sp. PR-3 TaxID=3120355 RepID=UPI002FCE6639
MTNRGFFQPQAWRYVKQLIFITLTMFVSAVCLGLYLIAQENFPLYLKDYYFDALLHHKMTHPKAPVDVLVVGDSTALNGVLPQTVTEHTQLSVYNGALISWAGIDAQVMVLDRYLERFPPPKAAVLVLSRNSPTFHHLYEKYQLAIANWRYRPLNTEKIQFLRQHPELLGTLMKHLGYIFLLGKLDVSGAYYQKQAALMAPLKGAKVLKGTRLKKDCKQRTWQEMPNLNYLSELKKNYRERGVNLLIYISPMPECDPDLANFSDYYAQHVDSPPFYMNDANFRDRLHLTGDGAKAHSKHFAQWLNKVRLEQR